jgi:uncharacterized protein YecT (DUF1311 family)
MNRYKYLVVLSVLGLAMSNSFAASFDCNKAQTALEKFICSHAQLNQADEQMGHEFRAVNASFPLKGFVLATQRSFIAGYPTCMLDNKGKMVATQATANACIKMVQARIAELRQYGKSKVYSNAKGKFLPDDLAILVYNDQGESSIRFWGNHMPDAYRPKPFPDGHLCDIEANLIPTNGKFKTDQTDDALISVTESSINLSSHISCSARTGIAEGSYSRLK